MLRIPFDEMLETLSRVLESKGFTAARANQCARLITEASCDGVYSHGLNRVPRFIAMIENGSVKVDAEPEKIKGFGALEQWDGHQGPGNLVAYTCMDQAIRLAQGNGIGCVALRNTNHWMRGGTYGWQAANAGCIALCWTNTNQNLPPWGGTAPRIGNNPLIIAVPRDDGHVVLDMAMSQYSYGALATHRKQGRALTVPGGFDVDGNLTTNASAIEESWRPLPIGYWKGSALSIVLDMTAALLSNGLSTREISSDPLTETGLSQVFIAIGPAIVSDGVRLNIIDDIITHLHESPTEPGKSVRYPGQNTQALRRENLELGIPVDKEIWLQVKGYIS